MPASCRRPGPRSARIRPVRPVLRPGFGRGGHTYQAPCALAGDEPGPVRCTPHRLPQVRAAGGRAVGENVPQAHFLVGAAYAQPAAVRAEQRVRMPARAVKLLAHRARPERPDLDRVADEAGQGQPAVPAKTHDADVVEVEELAARTDVPNPQGHVPAEARQPAAGFIEAEVLDVPVVADDSAAALFLLSCPRGICSGRRSRLPTVYRRETTSVRPGDRRGGTRASPRR